MLMDFVDDMVSPVLLTMEDIVFGNRRYLPFANQHRQHRSIQQKRSKTWLGTEMFHFHIFHTHTYVYIYIYSIYLSYII